MPGQGPLIPRRRLGAELRRLREAAGLHLNHAAAHLECSTSKISRLETGQGIPKSRDVRDLLGLYGLADQKAVDRLIRLVGEGKRQAWWQELNAALTTNLDQYISLESEASLQRDFSMSAIFGLLQTEEYARSLLRAIDPVAEAATIDKRVELRMQRQVAHRARTDRPRLDVILDESTLRRTVGSPATMREQLATLLEVNPTRHDRLRVLPFSAPPDMGTQCSFVIFTFDSDFDRNAVHIELPGGDRWLEVESDVRRYTEFFQSLAEKSLGEDESDAMISRIMAEHK
ncbi:helix-turn-helix domain-containing protein [Actinokineospora pegani]|uniref:helix-turn-helix domain-containing protein n=1 Tax=Actinokineospora pegani TaxID=2654637 RepID=UPI0012EAC95A|nr:helix-turn-helix transcriptional regulator [Actinokineospora pegani]